MTYFELMDWSESTFSGIQIKLSTASNEEGISQNEWKSLLYHSILRTTLICKACCRFMVKNAIAYDR